MSKKTGKSPAQGWFRILFMMVVTLMASSLAAYAQDESVPPNQCEEGCTSVSGTIRTCSGAGLPGVAVVMVGEVTGFTRTRFTTASGNFSSGSMPLDNYIVTPTPTTGFFFSPTSTTDNPAIFTRYRRDNRANFDGDCKTDISVFKDSTGVWTSQNSSNGVIVNYGFGTAGDIPAPGDYNADGRTDYAVFRPSEGRWYVDTDPSTPLLFDVYYFGLNGDIPVPRDYDGDAKTDVAVFRPSDGHWYILGTSSGFQAIQWGVSTDRVTPGDYDGDNRDDIAVFRPSEGKWYILKSTGGFEEVQFGIAEDLPVQADYDGDGRTDVAVFRPSTGVWWIRNSSTGWQSVTFSAPNMRVVPGDYTGDGRTDTALQVTTTGEWRIRDISNGFETSQIFSSDFPVPAAYLTPLY